MGRLAGFRYREITKKLSGFGFAFFRTGKGSHEIWYCAETDTYTTIPKHRGDIPEGTLRAILKQAQIEPNDFLSK